MSDLQESEGWACEEEFKTKYSSVTYYRSNNYFRWSYIFGAQTRTTKQIAKEYALYKHGFRLLEEQLAVYIKEHYEGVSKIEFSPIYEDGGDGYSMHTVRVVPIISDNHGHKAMLGTQIGRITYGSYGLGGELYLDFDRVDDSEIIILKDLDTQKELDLSSEEHLPWEGKVRVILQ